MRPGRGVEAALWMKDNGGTFQQAADRFGITRQAVNYAWQRVVGEPAPSSQRRERFKQRILELHATTTADELAVDMGISLGFVYILCRELRVHAKHPRRYSPEQIEEALRLVQDGTHTVSEAAVAAGLHYAALAVIMKDRGVHSTRVRSRNGRFAEASALMDRDETVTFYEAAAAFGVAPSGVREYRRRRGLRTTTK